MRKTVRTIEFTREDRTLITLERHRSYVGDVEDVIEADESSAPLGEADTDEADTERMEVYKL